MFTWGPCAYDTPVKASAACIDPRLWVRGGGGDGARLISEEMMAQEGLWIVFEGGRMCAGVVVVMVDERWVGRRAPRMVLGDRRSMDG